MSRGKVWRDGRITVKRRKETDGWYKPKVNGTNHKKEKWYFRAKLKNKFKDCIRISMGKLCSIYMGFWD